MSRNSPEERSRDVLDVEESPMSKVIPFPIVQRQALVLSIARRALKISPAAGERHIVRSLELQAATMRRGGVAEDHIRRELKALESTVRVKIVGLIFPRGGR
jgi:hypothetical protein